MAANATKCKCSLCNEFSVQDFCSVMRHIGVNSTSLNQTFKSNVDWVGVPCGTLCTAPLDHMPTGGIENC